MVGTKYVKSCCRRLVDLAEVYSWCLRPDRERHKEKQHKMKSVLFLFIIIIITIIIIIIIINNQIIAIEA